MILHNKTLLAVPLQVCRVSACVLALFAVGLTGCSDSPHDRVEAPAPAKMTTLPTPAKTTSDKPADKPVPVPSEGELGLPIYPGAKTYTDAGGMAVKPLTEGNMATAMLETTDSLDKVVDFYKDRIKQSDARGNTTPTVPREEKENDKRKVVVMGNDAQGNVQMVQLREETAKTVIELMRTSVKALPSGVSDGK